MKTTTAASLVVTAGIATLAIAVAVLGAWAFARAGRASGEDPPAARPALRGGAGRGRGAGCCAAGLVARSGRPARLRAPAATHDVDDAREHRRGPRGGAVAGRRAARPRPVARRAGRAAGLPSPARAGHAPGGARRRDARADVVLGSQLRHRHRGERRRARRAARDRSARRARWSSHGTRSARCCSRRSARSPSLSMPAHCTPSAPPPSVSTPGSDSSRSSGSRPSWSPPRSAGTS